MKQIHYIAASHSNIIMSWQFIYLFIVTLLRPYVGKMVE